MKNKAKRSQKTTAKETYEQNWSSDWGGFFYEIRADENGKNVEIEEKSKNGNNWKKKKNYFDKSINE